MNVESESLSVITDNCDNRLLPAGVIQGIGIVLRKRLHMGTSSHIEIHAGQVFVTEPEKIFYLNAPKKAVWLAIVGTDAAWSRHIKRINGGIRLDPPLLPAKYTASISLRRLVVSFARAHSRELKEKIIDAIIKDVIGSQLQFNSVIERCPGRTYAQRRQVFLRLQRAHKFMLNNFSQSISSASIARMSSYSICHFIRAFSAVYGETPYSFLTKTRLDNARSLLHETQYSISEIAQASGFDNASVFSRKFRQHFGKTAGEMRRDVSSASTGKRKDGRLIDLQLDG